MSTETTPTTHPRAVDDDEVVGLRCKEKGIRVREGKRGTQYIVEIGDRHVGSFKTREAAVLARNAAVLARGAPTAMTAMTAMTAPAPVAPRERKLNIDSWTGQTLPSGLRYDDAESAGVFFGSRKTRRVSAYLCAGGQQVYLGKYDDVPTAVAAQTLARERFDRGELKPRGDPGPLPASEWRIRPRWVWRAKKNAARVRFVVSGNGGKYVGSFDSLEAARAARDAAWQSVASA